MGPNFKPKPSTDHGLDHRLLDRTRRVELDPLCALARDEFKRGVRVGDGEPECSLGSGDYKPVGLASFRRRKVPRRGQQRSAPSRTVRSHDSAERHRVLDLDPEVQVCLCRPACVDCVCKPAGIPGSDNGGCQEQGPGGGGGGGADDETPLVGNAGSMWVGGGRGDLGRALTGLGHRALSLVSPSPRLPVSPSPSSLFRSHCSHRPWTSHRGPSRKSMRSMVWLPLSTTSPPPEIAG